MQTPWILTALLVLLPLSAVAETLDAPKYSPERIEHQEISLSKSLLPEFPFINQSLKMNEAIRLGLKYSPALQVTGADVAINQASLRQAGAQRWPVVSIGSNTFFHNRNNQTLMTTTGMMTTGRGTFLNDFNASAAVPLFTGGRIQAGIHAARATWEGSEAGYRQAQADTAFLIRQAYLTALLSEVEHTVHQLHLKVQDQLLENTQARYQVGRGLKADVFRVQAEIASARQMINEEHIRLNNTLYDLKATMGIDLASEITLSEPLTLNPWMGSPLDALIRTTAINHPRLLQAQKEIQAAKAEIKVVQSKYWPQVNGQITGNLRTPQDAPMMGNGVVGWLSATVPVFDRNRDTELAKAQATLAKAQQNLRMVKLDTARQIAQAWDEMTFARQNAELAEASVTQAEEDLRLTQRRFDVGRSILVEVQDSAYQLRQSRLNQAQAFYTHEMAKAKLLKALGQP